MSDSEEYGGDGEFYSERQFKKLRTSNTDHGEMCKIPSIPPGYEMIIGQSGSQTNGSEEFPQELDSQVIELSPGSSERQIQLKSGKKPDLNPTGPDMRTSVKKPLTESDEESDTTLTPSEHCSSDGENEGSNDGSLVSGVSEQSKELNVTHQWEDHPNPIYIDYDATGGKRGVVHIFNNYSFTDEEMNFDGGDRDEKNLLEVFKSLKYNVKIHSNRTKDEIDQDFLDIQRTKGLSEENAIIFFILSHGQDKYKFLSSDCEVIDLKEKMMMFRKDKCPALKHKTQLWFGDFCRGDLDQRGVGPFTRKDIREESETYYGKEEVFSNVLYIMSSNPGITSSYENDGSSFSLAICKMLNDGNYKLDDQWFMKLNTRYLRANNHPSTKRDYCDPFPGQLFYPEGFSFCYDVEEVNRKKLNARHWAMQTE